MAGTDFSTRTYSYDDYPGDVTLSNFALTEEDLVFKVKNIFQYAFTSYTFNADKYSGRFLTSTGL